jgi:hypothetical protein
VIQAGQRPTIRPRGKRFAVPVTAFLGLLCLAATGCGPFLDQQNAQNRADEIAGNLGAGGQVGQRFVSGCAGLSEVDVQIARFPDLPAGSGKLTVSIAADQGPDSSATPIGTVDAAESSLAANQWLAVTFPPVAGSMDRRFILQAWSSDPEMSPVTLWATSHQGSDKRERFTGAGQAPGSLVYRAYCEPGPLAVAIDRFGFLESLGLLWPSAIALSLLPGLAIGALVTRRDTDLAHVFGHAVGWSVLAAPVGLVLLGALNAGRYLGLGLVLVAVIGIAFRARNFSKQSFARSPAGETIVVLTGTVGAFAIRIATTTGLVVPMWVDSIQHAAITQSILILGRVPDTYAPFVASEVFDYHFGFHALAAAAAELAGSAPADAVLAVGQTLSALSPLAAYAFARDFLESKRAGAIAALLVGLVMTQPTYLITWGRYTELAGIVALPVVFWVSSVAFERNRGWRHVALAAAALASLVLVHPRVAVFTAALIVAWIGARAIESRDLAFLTRVAVRGVALSSLVGVALWPWLSRLMATQREHTLIPAAWVPIDFPIGIATAGADRWVAIAGLIGVGFLILRKPVVAVTLIAWSGLVVVAANPTHFGIPIYLWISNDSVAIGLFLPMAVLAGFALDSVAGLIKFESWRLTIKRATAGALVVLALSFSPAVVGTVNACCSLANLDDVAAWRWVRDSTPSDALFLINGYLWGENIWAGTDAGYWLPVMAQRRTSLPPLFYATGPAAEKAKVDQIAADVSQSEGDPAKIAAEARAIGATFVFVGSRGGVIDPGRLVQSSDFRQVFRAGGAWVFEVTGTGVGDGVDGIRSTVTAVTPVAMDTPKAENAAGLKSVTRG